MKSVIDRINEIVARHSDIPFHHNMSDEQEFECLLSALDNMERKIVRLTANLIDVREQIQKERRIGNKITRQTRH